MIADFLVIIGLLFIPAGTVSWLAGWVYVALLCGVTLLVVLHEENPGYIFVLGHYYTSRVCTMMWALTIGKEI